MASLRRSSVYERSPGNLFNGGEAGIHVYRDTPHSSSGSNSRTSLLPVWLQKLPRPRRRLFARSLGGGATTAVLLWAVLLFFGFFDPNLEISSHIDPRTFQVRPAGDPKILGLPNYVKPPNYWEFKAEWDAPSYELLSNTPPSARKCDKKGPLLFIGLFTHPNGGGRRQQIRTLFKPDLKVEGFRIDFKFIFGRPPNEEWRFGLQEEQKMFGDIVILENVVKDNIDDGKSIEYFKWMIDGLPDPKPQFVMKMDDDSFLVMPNVIRNFASLDCNEAVYWGTMQGASIDFFGPYMRGLCYAMSWPLASWIGTANVSATFASGVEDAKLGKMVASLDPQKEPVKWVDHGWKLGDWDQLKNDKDLIGYHWLKQDHWVPMVKQRALRAFKEAGREYRYDWERAQ